MRTPFAPAHLSSDTSAAVPWLATEYVPGATLHVAVREHGPLPEPMVRALGAAVAGALRDVHGLGIVHRDLKPANIVLSPDGPGSAPVADDRVRDRSDPARARGSVAPDRNHADRSRCRDGPGPGPGPRERARRADGRGSPVGLCYDSAVPGFGTDYSECT